MRKPEQQRSDQQGNVVTMGQVFEAPAQAALQVAAKQGFFYHRHQQEVVIEP
ncbi:hypothetical protein D3C76_1777270 [compost metagenome]